MWQLAAKAGKVCIAVQYLDEAPVQARLTGTFAFNDKEKSGVDLLYNVLRYGLL